MKTSLFSNTARWMILAAALGTAHATPEFAPDGNSSIADFISMDVKADNRMIGSKVEIAVDDGIATLSGTAISLEQAERAAARAKSTEGVRAVVNQLRIIDAVASDAVLAERVQLRLKKHEALDASRVKVTVDKRKATLSGQVGTWDEQELAREIATEIPGLKEIENRLEVSFDTVRTDAALRAQIQYQVADDPLYTGVRVDVVVKDGVVSLGGEVGSMGEKDQLVHRAHVTGVTEVWADDIMVNSDLAMEGIQGKVVPPATNLKSLDAAFAADSRLGNSNIHATFAESVVTLTGTVSNPEAKAAAESTARGLPGVSIVANELRVISDSDATAHVPKDQRMAATGD